MEDSKLRLIFMVRSVHKGSLLSSRNSVITIHVLYKHRAFRILEYKNIQGISFVHINPHLHLHLDLDLEVLMVD